MSWWHVSLLFHKNKPTETFYNEINFIYTWYILGFIKTNQININIKYE